MTNTTNEDHGMNLNLLEETLDSIKESGHSEDDVSYVGSNDGEYRIDWNQFKDIARNTWYGGYTEDDYTEIAYDRILVFDDGSRLVRQWQPESESWWEYRKQQHTHHAPKPFINVGTYENFDAEKSTIEDLNQ